MAEKSINKERERILDMAEESLRAGHAVTHTYCDNPETKKTEFITVKACYVNSKKNFKEIDLKNNKHFSIVNKTSFYKMGTKVTNVKVEVFKQKTNDLEVCNN